MRRVAGRFEDVVGCGILLRVGVGQRRVSMLLIIHLEQLFKCNSKDEQGLCPYPLFMIDRIQKGFYRRTIGIFSSMHTYNHQNFNMSFACVDLQLVVSQEPHQKFTCAICLQFMTNPCLIDCKHIFGLACIQRWVIHKRQRECPLCRKEFKTMAGVKELVQQAGHHSARCPSCHVTMPVTDIKQHFQTCEQHLAIIRARLETIIVQQKAWLQQEINPHLRESHAEIYATYVKDWMWLKDDPRNWKWWWWCNKPWWQNKSCPTCNTLWHKYEKEIDALQEKRVNLLEELGVFDHQEEDVGCNHS